LLFSASGSAWLPLINKAMRAAEEQNAQWVRYGARQPE
jgi:hypothetical protein